MRGWFESSNLNCAYSMYEPRLFTKYQPGGVANIDIDRLASNLTDQVRVSRVWDIGVGPGIKVKIA